MNPTRKIVGRIPRQEQGRALSRGMAVRVNFGEIANCKLGAVAPRHAAAPLRLGKGDASLSRCIPLEQGAFRGPHAPHDEEPGPVPATFPNRAPVGCAATAFPVASKIKGALLPRYPQRQAFAPDTTTKSVPPLDT